MVRKAVFTVLALALVLGFTAGVQADVMTYSGGGEIQWAAPENILGLSTESEVSWSVSYDPAWITELDDGNDGVVVMDYYGQGARLTVTLGSHTLREIYEYRPPDLSYPWIYTSGGQPGGFNLTAVLWDGLYLFWTEDSNSFTIASNQQQVYSAGGLEQQPDSVIMDGTLAYGVFNDMSQVPVPAAAWLLGSGLLGLAGLRRKFAE